MLKKAKSQKYRKYHDVILTKLITDYSVITLV